MISGLSGSGGSALLQQMRERMMGRLDADGDGAITQAEFTAGRPQGASEANAAERFATIDADGDGSLTETEISSHFQQLAPRTQGALLMAQGFAGSGERPDPVADLMTRVDSDGDGSVTKSELEAAFQSVASGGADEAAAAADALFAALDADSDGAVSESEVAQAMAPPRGHHGPPPPPPGAATGESSSDDLFASLDTNGDGVITRGELAAVTGQSDAAGGATGSNEEDDAATSLLALLQSAAGQQTASTVRTQMMDLLLKLQSAQEAA